MIHTIPVCQIRYLLMLLRLKDYGRAAGVVHFWETLEVSFLVLLVFALIALLIFRLCIDPFRQCIKYQQKGQVGYIMLIVCWPYLLNVLSPR